MSDHPALPEPLFEIYSHSIRNTVPRMDEFHEAQMLRIHPCRTRAFETRLCPRRGYDEARGLLIGAARGAPVISDYTHGHRAQAGLRPSARSHKTLHTCNVFSTLRWVPNLRFLIHGTVREPKNLSPYGTSGPAFLHHAFPWRRPGVLWSHKTEKGI